MLPKIAAAIISLSLGLLSTALQAGIHRAPVVIPGFKIKIATRYPLDAYRLYRSGPGGVAEPIPFQIDEINQNGDYVLDQGPTPNTETGNNIFNIQDELSFMGDDVGPPKAPTKWNTPKPAVLFEVRFSKRSTTAVEDVGAIYIGVHTTEIAPAKVAKKYVIFDANQGSVTTSRYRYEFDKKNYLVVNRVDMLRQQKVDSPVEHLPIIDSSTFYMKADLKYFLTFVANHRSVDSKLEAYKSGPVRSIVRVTFLYTILKLNFELGMYTEVSFFTNSVILPAIMYNPINGPDSLNKGSGFYYGFTLHDNPQSLNIQTNMQPYREARGIFDFLKGDQELQSKYWIAMTGADRMMYVEIMPSPKMLKDQNIPFFYQKPKAGTELQSIDNTIPKAIMESPVNLGLYFDLTRFSEGEHLMAFKLFFENKRDEAQMDTFKNLADWYYRISAL